jgi:4-amino-4-deoxy-L-arabinose transferase-like glycosyltransferase
MSHVRDPIDAGPAGATGRSLMRRIDWRALKVPALICLLALALRLLYLHFTGPDPLNSDAAQYSEIARNLASGHGFSAVYPQLATHETAFRPPLYPFLLAGFYWLFGASTGLARGINVVLGVGVVALTFYVVQRGISRQAAVWAALTVAVLPNLIANDTFALDEPLALLLILFMVDCLLHRRWIWAGAAVGALTLTRPSAQFLVVVLAVWVLFRVGWKKMLLFVVMAGLVVTPWVIRNWVQIGTPTITTSNGFNWAAIYGPPAQQRGVFVDPVYSPYYNSHRVLQFNEEKWNSYLERVGVDNLERHPTYLPFVVVRNFAAYFELKPSYNVGAESEDGRDLHIVNGTLWIFYLEVVVGAAGLFLRRKNDAVRLLFIQAAYFTVASLFFIAVPRLRAPIDLALAVGVGCFVEWAGTRFGRQPPDHVEQPQEMPTETGGPPPTGSAVEVSPAPE